MVKRTIVIIQQALLILSCIGYLVVLFALPSNSPWRFVLLGSVIICTVWHIVNTRCPHCGRFGGLKHKLLPKECVTCIHCKETADYE